MSNTVVIYKKDDLQQFLAAWSFNAFWLWIRADEEFKHIFQFSTGEKPTYISVLDYGDITFDMIKGKRVYIFDATKEEVEPLVKKGDAEYIYVILAANRTWSPETHSVEVHCAPRNSKITLSESVWHFFNGAERYPSCLRRETHDSIIPEFDNVDLVKAEYANDFIQCVMDPQDFDLLTSMITSPNIARSIVRFKRRLEKGEIDGKGESTPPTVPTVATFGQFTAVNTNITRVYSWHPTLQLRVLRRRSMSGKTIVATQVAPDRLQQRWEDHSAATDSPSRFEWRDVEIVYEDVDESPGEKADRIHNLMNKPYGL